MSDDWEIIDTELITMTREELLDAVQFEVNRRIKHMTTARLHEEYAALMNGLEIHLPFVSTEIDDDSPITTEAINE
jgi:hypothetical protein